MRSYLEKPFTKKIGLLEWLKVKDMGSKMATRVQKQTA
jgi:hypothetical protein